MAETPGGGRVALVIGNSGYEFAPPLKNPVNDTADVAAALSRLGFAVTRRVDLDYRQMRLVLRDFAEQAQDAEIALVYFAGHGIEVDKSNFLIPVDAELQSDLDVEFEAIPLDRVLRSVSLSSGLRIVMVDACRNNPFSRGMTRTVATRSTGTGLARVDPVGGVLVSYAAREGTLALDGQGRNSPYALALLKHLEEPGLEIGKLFRRVRDTVFEMTNGRQEPFTYGSLPGTDIYLKPPERPQFSGLGPAAGEPDGLAKAYAFADMTGTVAGWDDFLKRFGENESHPLVKRADVKRTALRRELKSVSPDARELDAEAQKIRDELVGYSAAERLASPRGWALYFHRFQIGRLTQSAIAREELAVMSDVRARVYGRYRSAFDGQTMTAEMRRAGLDLIQLPANKVHQMQFALKSRGNDIGVIDGQIGPRTTRALGAVQRASGLPVTGLPTRATMAVLGQLDSGLFAPSMFATSGAIARVIDPGPASFLENDARLTRLLETFRGRNLIYGYFQGRLYAAVYLGTTIGEAELDRYMASIGGALAEIDSPEEYRFLVDMIRFDQKLWTRGTGAIGPGYGPSIGLRRGDAGRWGWRSGKALGYAAWAPGQPSSDPQARYGRLVPFGAIPRNAHQLREARWGVTDQIAHTILIEVE